MKEKQNNNKEAPGELDELIIKACEILGVNSLTRKQEAYIITKYMSVKHYGVTVELLEELYKLKLNMYFKKVLNENEDLNRVIIKKRLFNNLIYDIQKEVYEKTIKQIGKTGAINLQ